MKITLIQFYSKHIIVLYLYLNIQIQNKKGDHLKAVQFHEFGESNQLKVCEIAKPIPKEDQLLIRVQAIGVNYADIMRRRGAYLEPTPLPFIPGLEVSGVIEEVGNKVTQYSPGDRVVALLLSGGGYAEYVAVNQELVTVIPDGISFEEAAALPLQGLTSYYILQEMARMRSGENVLVHAAAGGVGTLAIQLAKTFGAKHIIATASNNEKLKVASSLGADILIDYTQDDWEEKILAETEGYGVDVILEMVGGDVFYKSLKCLSPFGRIIVYGRASRQETIMDPRVLMKRNQSISGFFLGECKDHVKNNQVTKQLFQYVQEGNLTVLIGGVFPLEDAPRVHDLMEQRKTHGKLILKLS